MATDKYGNQLRHKYHVADLRGDSKLTGTVLSASYPPVGPFRESGQVTVAWDSGDEETLSATDVVVTDRIINGRRNRR